MASEIRGVSSSGTLYARVMNASGQIWNTAALTFEDYTASDYTDYDITMTQQGSSGVYVGDFPSNITTAGTYEFFVHIQSGGTPAEGDTIVNTGRIEWTGSAATSTSTADATNLVTEALKKAGISSPSDDEIDRASDYWLQEILNDIWMKSIASGNSRLKTLAETLIDVSTLNVRVYDLPDAMDEELELEVLDGSRYDTAQTATSTTITLDADDTGTASNTEGKWILITSGLGVDEFKQITDYDSTTKIATVESAWTSTPNSSSTYLIVDQEYQLDEIDLAEMGTASPVPGRPTAFAKYNRQLIFDRPWDRATYGIRLRYYMNIHSVDTTGGSTSRWGRIITNWKNVLTQGVFYKALEDNDDPRAPKAKGDYEQMVGMLLIKEIPYGGAFKGFSV
jgi:hypothetical protein